MHRHINPDHTPQSPETQKALDDLCEEYKDTFSLHQGNTGYNKLPTTDIHTGDHPAMAQKLYTLPLKHTQWVREELEVLGMA